MHYFIFLNKDGSNLLQTTSVQNCEHNISIPAPVISRRTIANSIYRIFIRTSRKYILPTITSFKWYLQKSGNNRQIIKTLYFQMICAPSEYSAWASIQSDQSSLSAWRNFGSLATHGADSKDSDQTGWMPRLIRVFAGCSGHFVGFVMLWLIYISLLCYIILCFA